jgi:hypothetical protein
MDVLEKHVEPIIHARYRTRDPRCCSHIPLKDSFKGEVQLGFGFTTTPAKADKVVDVAHPPKYTTPVHCSVCRILNTQTA